MIGDATGENMWGGHLCVIMGGDLSVEKKIERAMGPWISMAFDGWADTTTNQKLAEMMLYIFGRRRAGR